MTLMSHEDSADESHHRFTGSPPKFVDSGVYALIEISFADGEPLLHLFPDILPLSQLAGSF